jgi:symplekin
MSLEISSIRFADLKPLLTPEAVTELVMATMKYLPSHQPRTFRSSYTPIAAAGTDAQVHGVVHIVCMYTCMILAKEWTEP